MKSPLCDSERLAKLILMLALMVKDQMLLIRHIEPSISAKLCRNYRNG